VEPGQRVTTSSESRNTFNTTQIIDREQQCLPNEDGGELLNNISLWQTCAQITLPEIPSSWVFIHKFAGNVLQTFRLGCRFCAMLVIGFDLALNIKRNPSLGVHKIKLRYWEDRFVAELGLLKSIFHLEEILST
jgi:hypothetical protein